MSASRLGVLDADRGLTTVLVKRAQERGWRVVVLDGAEGLDPGALRDRGIAALVLDPEVLGTGAWNRLERLCGELPELGVVVCTRPSSVAERVRGLRLGADDWVSKPCHAEELMARVEAVARRRRGAVRDRADAHVGDLTIRPSQFQAFCRGRSLGLTRREFELLALLAEAAGRVLEREEMYRRVWGYEMARGDRSVDVFVRKLRAKLEAVSPDVRYIHTHVGTGYRLAAEPVAA